MKRLKVLLLVLGSVALIGCASFNCAPMAPTSCEMEAFSIACQYEYKTGLPTKISGGKSWNGRYHAVPIALYKGKWMKVEKGFIVEGTQSHNMGLAGMDALYLEEVVFTKREFFNLCIKKYLED